MMDAQAGRKAIEARIAPLLGPGAAAVLGLSTGFFCYAMPATVIGRVFDPAALGGQGLIAGVATLLVGGATWAGFARFDRPTKARYIALASAARETEAAPVLRRADAHPDAPARRPIFAGSDLGTPLDLIEPDTAAPPANAPETIAPTPFPALMEAGPARYEDATTEPERCDEPETSDPSPPSVIEPAAAAAPEAPLPSLPPIVAVQPTLAPGEPVTPLPVMMRRLEAGLARKALVLAGAEPNVTALRREIRPVSGPLSDAVEVLQARTASRR